MIIARSPLRISLGGGGTDLPSYYHDHEGFLVSAAIDKYVYVTVMRPFSEGIYLKYSQLEHVEKIADGADRGLRQPAACLLLRTPQQWNDGRGLLARRILGDRLSRPRKVLRRKSKLSGLIGMHSANSHQRLLKPRSYSAE